jgi:hypothetical protein
MLSAPLMRGVTVASKAMLKYKNRIASAAIKKRDSWHRQLAGNQRRLF